MTKKQLEVYLKDRQAQMEKSIELNKRIRREAWWMEGRELESYQSISVQSGEVHVPEGDITIRLGERGEVIVQNSLEDTERTDQEYSPEHAGERSEGA